MIKRIVGIMISDAGDAFLWFIKDLDARKICLLSEE